MEGAPLFSVVMPVYEPRPPLLRAAIGSVRAQTLSSWELCIVDDGSRGRGVRRAIEREARRDDRIKARFLERNSGISAASNRGLGEAGGRYVAFLDHDDLLEPRALERVATVLEDRPDTDVLYTDQVTVSANARHRLSEFHKPDWSPVYALGAMYIGHLLVAKRSLVEAAGGFDSAFDTIQDFELLLRLAERTDHIHHLPEVLYRWRAVPGSIAAGALEKPGVPELQARAVNAHLRRRGIDGVEAVPHHSIPHRNWLLPSDGRSAEVSVVRIGRGRRPAARANAAARAERGEFLLFLGEEVRGTDPSWVDRLAACAGLPGVGAAGPLLLRPDGRVAGAGFRAAQMDDPVAPLAEGADPDGDGYYGSLSCAREVYALSGRALLVHRMAFERAGGFEEKFVSTHWDFDLCRKLGRLGLSCVFTPTARAVDREPAEARERAVDVIDRALFVDAWFDELIDGDSCSREPRLP